MNLFSNLHLLLFEFLFVYCPTLDVFAHKEINTQLKKSDFNCATVSVKHLTGQILKEQESRHLCSGKGLTRESTLS